jgi:hypothetical protein
MAEEEEEEEEEEGGKKPVVHHVVFAPGVTITAPGKDKVAEKPALNPAFIAAVAVVSAAAISAFSAVLVELLKERAPAPSPTAPSIPLSATSAPSIAPMSSGLKIRVSPASLLDAAAPPVDIFKLWYQGMKGLPRSCSSPTWYRSMDCPDGMYVSECRSENAACQAEVADNHWGCRMTLLIANASSSTRSFDLSPCRWSYACSPAAVPH